MNDMVECTLCNGTGKFDPRTQADGNDGAEVTCADCGGNGELDADEE